MKIGPCHSQDLPPLGLPRFESWKDLSEWGETLGVLLDVTVTMPPTADHPGLAVVGWFERLQATAPGSGRAVFQALIDHADHQATDLGLVVTGGNSSLEDYYRSFGFDVLEHTRNEETADVELRRHHEPPRSPQSPRRPPAAR